MAFRTKKPEGVEPEALERLFGQSSSEGDVPPAEGETMTTLSVLDGLRAYAAMMNRLDAAPLEPHLAPDFSYASQWVFAEIRSRDEYLAYIRPKLETIRSSGASVWAELGKLTGFPGGPCVLVAQGSRDNLVATVLLEVADGRITRIDMCAVPPPTSAIRTGEYPQ